MGINQENAKSFEEMANEMDAATEAVVETTETVAEETVTEEGTTEEVVADETTEENPA